MTNLNRPNWVNLGNAILATNQVMHLSLSTSNAPAKYYRVVLSPK